MKEINEPLPDRIGPYEIVKRIGRGGMAELFLAKHRGPGGFERQVALKRVLPQVSGDPRFVSMFLREAGLAAQLSHPNIVHLYDFFQDATGYVIAMEYVKGANLVKLLSAGLKKRMSLRVGHVIRIMTGVLEALDHAGNAHNSEGEPFRIIHRDVTPSNIMIGTDGSVKLLDFGIAKAAIEERSETLVGGMKGKFPYMSPEAVKSAPMDHRSDLWSVGVMLWEITTGRTLFRRQSDYETLDAIVNHRVPNPSEVVPDYPPRLAQIVMKALEKDPNERYRDARSIITELQAFGASAEWSSGPHGLAGILRTFLDGPTGEDTHTLSWTPPVFDHRSSARAIPSQIPSPFDVRAPAGPLSAVIDSDPPSPEIEIETSNGRDWFSIAAIVFTASASAVFWMFIFPAM